jgi:hypothetical protein
MMTKPPEHLLMSMIVGSGVACSGNPCDTGARDPVTRAFALPITLKPTSYQAARI